MSIEIEKNYDAKKYEDKIYKRWEESGAFTPEIDESKKPFVISMPPPNATGQLHLGHSMTLVFEDIMIRQNRMKGIPTLWLPGTDHASIATQNKVEKILAIEGKTKHDLGRKDFLNEIHKYVANSQDIIRKQVRKMGSSCDWTRERYTLDKGLNNAVEEVFIRMFNDGLIYRGNRIVNWCPRCESTLSDDEVNHKENHEKLYWIKYGPFSVATTRPETMLGDTAVAVHPDDKRYKEWIGKKVKIPYPLGEFEVTVVGDTEVDPKFGTGAVKVTPAHSFIDFEIAKRHKIEVKPVIDEKGIMMKNCDKYAGLTTSECRKLFIDDLDKMNLIEKIEDYTNNLSICYRCDHSIEPLISKQWFIDVNKPIIKEGSKKISIKEKSLQVVKNGDIKIIPNRFSKTYSHWMENLHDWCISRQIWFGHRIPVWYCKSCNETIASKEKPGTCKCKSVEWKQDPDTLDTWFSSGIWTFSTLGWPEKTEDFKYFHPTSVLETGYDILPFWVSRMILMTTYTLGEIPFKTVYLHGMVRDKQGRKMSKSLDNGIDPLDMIEKYGTDALRLSLVIGTTPGNDTRIYEEKIESYRNFITKIWNSARFALMNVEEEDIKKEFEVGMIKTASDKWILTKLQTLIKEVNKDLEKYKFSEAGSKIYDFIWGTYCDWYLEMSKGDDKNPAILIYVLKETLTLLHPFTPFVTEKLWEYLDGEKMLITRQWPSFSKKLYFEEETKNIDLVNEIITKIRSIRAEAKVAPGKEISATIYGGKSTQSIEQNREIIMRMAKLESLDVKEKGAKILDAKAGLVDQTEIYLPLKGLLDFEVEIKRLNKEITNKENFIESFRKKITSKGFADKAPKEVIEKGKERLKNEEENLVKLIKQRKELEV